jgi:type IV secretory pathway TrbD component
VVNKIRRNMNKAMIESYLRNLLGSAIGAVSIVMGSTGIASPLDFGTGEWMLVANAIWASAIPTLLRWANKKDPTFGLVAAAAAASVTKKLSAGAKPAAKKTSTKKSGGGSKPKQAK